MQETEDIVTRLRDWCMNVRRKPSPLSDAIPMAQEAADTIATLRDELKDVTAHCDGLVDQAATLRAEVEGLRAHAKKCDEWMEEAVEYVNRQMRSPSLEREGRDLRCRYAAIDAAKADKEGA